jgi:hypothetical protein
MVLMNNRKAGRILLMLLVAGLAIVSTDRTRVAAEGNTEPLVRYRIDARLKLDQAQRPVEIDGRQQLTWLNTSTEEVGELQFHLYLNAFKNQKSTFFRESGGQLRQDTFSNGEWGWIDIREMRIVGGEDLRPRIQYIHPDDENTDDQTVIRVPLTQPLKPGEKIVLDIAFSSRLPRVFARTGYWGTFAMVGQWFPKIGVWEPVGKGGRASAGWNCHQFHANSEFYADFGVFDVNLTVPEVYRGRIGATGSLKSERVNTDQTVTYNFHQENVHDFAWTVDTQYEVYRRKFKADREVTTTDQAMVARRFGQSLEAVALRDVEVTLLLQPEHRSQVDRHFQAAFNAIKYFGLWYGKYPYDTLTIVDPPYNASGAEGMEYPTLITAGTRWRAGLDQNPEMVIVHEFGHQYWQGMVASNEFEESWLDEGFNTWSTSNVLQAAYGDDRLPVSIFGINWFYLPLSLPHPYENRLMTLRGRFDDPILTPVWKYYDSMSYSINSYPRTGLVLGTLERYLGEEQMARIMREYFRRWQYRHPTSTDFFKQVNDMSGQDLGWFFDQFVRGTQTVDYEISEAESESLEAELGFIDTDGGRTLVTNPSVPEPRWRTKVTVRRTGEAIFPVDIQLTFSDGSRIVGLPQSLRDGVIEYRFEDSRDGAVWTASWPMAERWMRITRDTPSMLIRADVDPWRKVLLDANLTNNSRLRATGLAPAGRWATGALFWVQVVMQFFIAI